MDRELDELKAQVEPALRRRDLPTLAGLLYGTSAAIVSRLLEREDAADRAVLYRLLPREQALEVFELLDSAMRAELFVGLRHEDVARVFEELDPDDRAQLVDELPAGVARRLMSGLSAGERELTAPMLGYARGTIGRHMSTEYVRLQPQLTVGDALSHVRHRGHSAETIYTLPVTDSARRMLGVVGLRELVMGDAHVLVGDVMVDAHQVHATDDAEVAARSLVDAQLLAAPVVDGEDRLLGILTVDDASRILDDAEAEDAARQGASEPLRRPYLTTPVLGIVRARVTWLLVLAVSALLTVQVLDVFEATLEQVVTLALFIPLLTGTAGNTGAQAATTVTRALAVGDVRPRDSLLVAWREVRVGLLLGGLLGILGLVLGSIAFDFGLGAVIGLTLLAVCTLAATVGGVMPMLARAVGADPAVFSTPFISTFCDATSLIIYFGMATWILQL
ncbi:magnesium transporter [Microbacterium halimionae]|uniref:Magnesium transporter MgtE n=1 Tax=Microbacterium halimionae TaxID=1526413 RepID=A0A7W3JN45_9MICO|nr:magnesium transporter [Microbacterium halimionae]MBA8815935.1 magnesium transporter [Microbacterium halimionae]NII96138.1 magnesium transporter [Microbacterium halimionae]